MRTVSSKAVKPSYKSNVPKKKKKKNQKKKKTGWKREEGNTPLAKRKMDRKRWEMARR